MLPHLARGRPNVVVFDEDIGLATLGIGSRGALARGFFTRPQGPGCARLGQPCGALGALAAVTAAYAGPLAAFQQRFPGLSGLSQRFVAATDTVVRSFMGTFSTLARRDGIYMIGSADVPAFSQSRAAGDLAALSDPDLQPRPSSVYVADSAQVHDQVFMWGPRNVRTGGPDVLRNVVASNLKVPLPPLEVVLGLTRGPATGVRCLNHLGANLVIQGRGQPRQLDRCRRQRNRAVAADVVDELHLSGRQRPERALRLQRHRDDGGEPGRPAFNGRSAITQRGLLGDGPRHGPVRDHG